MASWDGPRSRRNRADTSWTAGDILFMLLCVVVYVGCAYLLVNPPHWT